jgi:pre-mRNA-splicing helicase BRR2
MLLLNEILYEKVMERASNYQMIVFVHSRRDTVRTANNLKDTAFAKNELNRLLKPDSDSKRLLEKVVEQESVNSKDLKELLVHGIGIHHAGLSRSDRDLVESLFSDRHLSVLVSTATLAWGVNLPAHTVIIKGTQVYSP